MAKRGGFPGGMPGNMSNLMKQAQRMQRQMEEAKQVGIRGIYAGFCRRISGGYWKKKGCRIICSSGRRSYCCCLRLL